jgi:hypothetical protein
MKVGLVAGAYRPFHAGHDALIRLASKENDKVIVFASLTDRDNISGEGMMQVWKQLIEPSLPDNVEVTYGGSPVGHAYKVIGDADQAGSQDTFTVYSDPDDANRMATLPKYAPNLTANGQVKFRPVERASTVNVSGTQMRLWFDNDERDQFVAHLPDSIDGDRVWDILKATKPDKPVPKGAKKPKKPPVQGEGLVREFVRLQLGQR